MAFGSRIPCGALSRRSVQLAVAAVVSVTLVMSGSGLEHDVAVAYGDEVPAPDDATSSDRSESQTSQSKASTSTSKSRARAKRRARAQRRARARRRAQRRARARRKARAARHHQARARAQATKQSSRTAGSTNIRTGTRTGPPRSARSCLKTLDRLGVTYQTVTRQGIDIAVKVEGDIAGVTYRGYLEAPLVLDCSLVVSLAAMGHPMREHGIEQATYSSSYQRRKVRGSDRWSRHSFGLALDVHVFAGDQFGTLSVKDDYEQGLGDEVDCVGQPLTEAGATLRTLACQFERSEHFRMLLTPDSDAAHYNHFHIEALPWAERGDEIPPPR